MPTATGAPDWDVEGRDWPFRSESRFVRAAGIVWHVSQMGQGPPLLLVHGTGAATHTWRGLAPILSPRFALTMIDLPGHGFTEMPAEGSPGLDGMSGLIGGLLQELGVEPQYCAGHSAGAAILARMCLDGRLRPKALHSINGAFLPFSGMARYLPPALTRLLFVNSIVVNLTASRGSDPAAVERLLTGTGSRLEPRGIELYARLFGAPRHVRAALGMMAAWRLEELVRDLPRLATRLVLIASGEDTAVPPDQAFQVKARVPSADVRYLRRLGHLAHEEDPEAVAQILIETAGGEAPLRHTINPTPDGAS